MNLAPITIVLLALLAVVPRAHAQSAGQPAPAPTPAQASAPAKAEPTAADAPLPADANAFEVYAELHAELAKLAEIPAWKADRWGWDDIKSKVKNKPEHFAPLLKKLIEATRLEKCESGLERTIETPLMHLTQRHVFGRWLDDEARRALAAGRKDQAVEHCAALARLARHLSLEGTVAERLVGMSLLISAVRVADESLAQNTTTGADWVLLLDELQRFDPKDPFDLLSGLRLDRDMVGAVLREGSEQGLAMISHQRKTAMTPREARAIAPKFEAAMDRIIKAWDAGDGAGVKAAHAEFAEEKDGWVMPNVSSLWDNNQKLLVMLGALRAKLEPEAEE